jgi:uncharacterized protein YndB with AHSA1/START domain
MSNVQFVYVTYIAAKPEQIWKALLDAQFTRQYWGHDNVSDWKPGSAWEHRANDDARTLRLVGKVVESAPPRRLVLTWAAPEDVTDAGKHSRVTFALEPLEDMTRLTVTHDELGADSEMAHKISEGWPRVLSSLKSLLETGRPLRTWAGRGS